MKNMTDWSKNILEGLNPQQKEAVQHVDGPLLVIAGAGSGKTRVLTNRIAYLINQGIPPHNILAVTFTNKAANEMKERVMNTLSSNGDESGYEYATKPLIGTFHAVCLRFLRSHLHLLGYENSFVIYDTADQEALMKQILKDFAINDKTYAPKAILYKISSAKNYLKTPAEYAAKAHNQFTQVVGQCYSEYQRRLKLSQALDFDDIIMMTIQLFREYPEILATYQDRFRYLLVDEYQDTNFAQFVLTDMLAKKYGNLMVVGDVDQSIYGFRGANASNILDFQKQFPGAKIVKLEQNYRSTQAILEVAHNVIVKNKSRHEKQMFTENEGGDQVEVLSSGSSREEAIKIAQTVLGIKKREPLLDFSSFSVLYRTNAQSRVMEEAFLRYGIPYRIIGGVKFYSRKEIKDVIAYLRVIQNRHDDVSLLRIVNVPARKIGPKTISTLREYGNAIGMSLFDTMSACESISDLSAGKKETIQKFVNLINHLKEKSEEYNVAGLLKYLLIETGYKEFLLENSDVVAGKNKKSAGLGTGQTRLENVYELISVASKYNELEPDISLSTFLEEVSLIADVDSLDASEDAVILMTIHSAKGLEFPYVFVGGLEEGLFPHFNSMMDPESLEEERRLMYVAITRAEQKLYLSFARSRMYYGDNRECIPSQFLKDIPEECLKGDLHHVHGGDSYSPFGSEQHTTNLISDSRQVQRRHISYGSTQFTKQAPADPLAEDAEVSLSKGDRVMHKTWGEGVVIQVTGGIVDIKFKDIKVGEKKLALSIAPLTKIS